MSTAPITDHVARAQANFLSQFAKSDKLLQLIEAINKEVQVHEDFQQEILLETLLDNAEGVQLDNIYGQLIGLLRSFMDDDQYRLALSVRMIANYSKTEVETILLIASTFFQVSVKYRQHGRAGYTLEWFVPSPGTDIEFSQLGGKILADATGAAINYHFVEADDPDGLVLGVGPALGTGILGRGVASSYPGIQAP